MSVNQLSSERSFSQLLRQSRLATYDPTLPQVYMTYGRFKNQGDWGLKRNLPKVLRTNVVTVQALDTSEHQTPFRSAQKLVRFTRKWKENFPWSKFPSPMKDKVLRNISLMSSKQFEKFLKEAEEKKHEWRIKKKDTYSPENWLQFMNAINDKSPPTVVGLTYSHNNPGTNILVEGRVLNKELLGYAVGISGIVAHLPTKKALRVGMIEREKVEKFYVENAEFNESGRAIVRLSQLPTVSRQDTLGYPSVSRPIAGFLDSGARQREDPDVQRDLLEKISQLAGGKYIGIGPMRVASPQSANQKEIRNDQSGGSVLFGPGGLFDNKTGKEDIERVNVVEDKKLDDRKSVDTMKAADNTRTTDDKSEIEEFFDLMDEFSKKNKNQK